jgi:hypothetical protein
MRVVICTVSLVLVMGCGGGASQSTDGGTGASIKLSGKLIAGAQTPYPPPPLPPPPAPAPGDPLVGYQLYCVTFADPPTAATGTADAAGQVTLDLDALGVAFGCFVLDEQGDPVASLVFTAGLQRGQTITLTDDTDLGSITVDLNNGVAESGIPGTGTLTGSAGFTCPLGAWVVSVPTQDCNDPAATAIATATFWVVQNAAGQYSVTFTIGPILLPDTHACGYHTYADLPATESGGALTFSFLNSYTCSVVFDTLVATPNADCTQLSLIGSVDGCVSCSEGQCGCGGGSLSCPQSFTGTRQLDAGAAFGHEENSVVKAVDTAG